MAQVTILLVDDDPLIRFLGQALLEHCGYQVEAAEDGVAAIQLYQRLEKVDLVILDYYLPGLNGLEVLAQLKILDPQVRVLMISGFFSTQDAARLSQEGAQGVIHKPFRLVDLESRIRKVLS
jgi:two-component system cell cycle sensor histidine kinase/response regulator CckA